METYGKNKKLMKLNLPTTLTINGVEAGEKFKNCIDSYNNVYYNFLLNFDFANNIDINSGKVLGVCCDNIKCSPVVFGVACPAGNKGFACNKLNQEIFCFNIGCGGIIGNNLITGSTTLVAPFPKSPVLTITSISTSLVEIPTTTTQQVTSATAINNSPNSITPTPTPLSDDNSHLTEKIAIPIGATIGAITVGGITYYLIQKRKNKPLLVSGNTEQEVTNNQNEKDFSEVIASTSQNKELPILPVQGLNSQTKNDELTQLIQQTKEKIGVNLILALETLLDTQIEITQGNNNFAIRQLQREAKEKLQSKLSLEEINNLCQLQSEQVFLDGEKAGKLEGKELNIENFDNLEYICVKNLPDLIKITIKNCNKLETLEYHLEKKLEVILVNSTLEIIKSSNINKKPVVVYQAKDETKTKIIPCQLVETYLQQKYPTEQAKAEITKLYIVDKGLEGNLDLTDFPNLEKLYLYNNCLTKLNLNNFYPRLPSNLEKITNKNKINQEYLPDSLEKFDYDTKLRPNCKITTEQLREQLKLLEAEKARLTKRIVDLETLTAESERLVKEQKEKIVKDYLLFTEEQEQMLQKLISFTRTVEIILNKFEELYHHELTLERQNKEKQNLPQQITNIEKSISEMKRDIKLLEVNPSQVVNNYITTGDIFLASSLSF
ncbi:218_t:CDS:10 [Entrophospora sp. SA101]|nr:218_t:CDS:10 [Entrophospora sp. SA101]